MTAFKPKNSNKNKYFGFFVKLLLLVIVGGVIWIHQYNQVADKRYQIRETKKEITELEVENAELKNKLFEITDPSHLEKEASSRGLVLDSNPDYLNLNRWVSDSSY